MTQVKLWQIVSQTANAIIFSDGDGNLKSLAPGAANQILVAGFDGSPVWEDNTALETALQAQTDAASAIATANAYTVAQIAALVDNAPIALNTLNELAIKLNGEDSAINALLLQVDGKAEKTEVATQVAQAKQDAISDGKVYTDSAIATSGTATSAQIGAAKSEAIAVAAVDAGQKANQALASANAYADTAASSVFETLTSSVEGQVDMAKTAAVAQANSYTDGALATGLANVITDAQNAADAARAAAIDTAAQDAGSKVADLQAAIPNSFWVEGTAIAVFVGSTMGMYSGQATEPGMEVADLFTEVMGAAVSPNDPTLNAKLLFVNGVAMSQDWETSRTVDNRLVIKFSPALAMKVFDGSANSVMLLAEYTSYKAISLKS